MVEKKVKKTRVFMMTVDQAIIFYKLVGYFKKIGLKDTVEMRTSILNAMAEEGEMKTVFDTHRTEEEIVKSWTAKGFNIKEYRKKDE